MKFIVVLVLFLNLKKCLTINDDTLITPSEIFNGTTVNLRCQENHIIEILRVTYSNLNNKFDIDNIVNVTNKVEFEEELKQRCNKKDVCVFGVNEKTTNIYYTCFPNDLNLMVYKLNYECDRTISGVSEGLISFHENSKNKNCKIKITIPDKDHKIALYIIDMNLPKHQNLMLENNKKIFTGQIFEKKLIIISNSTILLNLINNYVDKSKANISGYFKLYFIIKPNIQSILIITTLKNQITTKYQITQQQTNPILTIIKNTTTNKSLWEKQTNNINESSSYKIYHVIIISVITTILCIIIIILITVGLVMYIYRNDKNKIKFNFKFLNKINTRNNEYNETKSSTMLSKSQVLYEAIIYDQPIHNKSLENINNDNYDKKSTFRQNDDINQHIYLIPVKNISNISHL